MTETGNSSQLEAFQNPVHELAVETTRLFCYPFLSFLLVFLKLILFLLIATLFIITVIVGIFFADVIVIFFKGIISKYITNEDSIVASVLPLIFAVWPITVLIGKFREKVQHKVKATFVELRGFLARDWIAQWKIARFALQIKRVFGAVFSLARSGFTIILLALCLLFLITLAAAPFADQTRISLSYVYPESHGPWYLNNILPENDHRYQPSTFQFQKGANFHLFYVDSGSVKDGRGICLTPQMIGSLDAFDAALKSCQAENPNEALRLKVQGLFSSSKVQPNRAFTEEESNHYNVDVANKRTLTVASYLLRKGGKLDTQGNYCLNQGYVDDMSNLSTSCMLPSCKMQKSEDHLINQTCECHIGETNGFVVEYEYIVDYEELESKQLVSTRTDQERITSLDYLNRSVVFEIVSSPCWENDYAVNSLSQNGL
ncbi:MAG: hypothetical protein OXG15_03155 [Gammaproteobacteria bacterium]|nr:hypothetical protein [Gammaproteobacteria bacterium]